MNTRGEKQATAISAIAAMPAIAKSIMALWRTACASRGLNGSAMEIGWPLRLGEPLDPAPRPASSPEGPERPVDKRATTRPTIPS